MRVLIIVICCVFMLCQGKLSFGGCPKLNPVPYSADMQVLRMVKMHYVDKLPANMLTLASLLILKKYQSLDCVAWDFENYALDENNYNVVAFDYFNSGRYPFKAAVTGFDSETGTYVATICADAQTLNTGLANMLAQGNLPKAFQTLISLASYFFRFAHFQLTLAGSEVLDYTVEQANRIEGLITKTTQIPYMKRI